mmetsp:Transcript_28209/g.61302  ORF Transcript_28209/g.61302 Transcript_28209/m.61302 type:complete len:91 (+) Transcript_28209:261-533(+)
MPGSVLLLAILNLVLLYTATTTTTTPTTLIVATNTTTSCSTGVSTMPLAVLLPRKRPGYVQREFNGGRCVRLTNISRKPGVANRHASGSI